MAADVQARTLTPSTAARRSTPSTPNLNLIAVTLILFAGHLAFGANRTDTALEFTLLYAVGFLFVRYLTGWGRAAERKSNGLVIPAVLFLLVLAGSALAMSPFAIGGSNPLWAFVPWAVPAAVLDRSSAFIELIKLGGLACVFCLGVLISQDVNRARRFLYIFLIVGTLYAAWALIAHLADSRSILGVAKIFHRNRLTASFLSANTAATLFGYMSVLMAALLVERLRNAVLDGRKADHIVSTAGVFGVGLFISLICVVLTASRAGMVATVFALGFFAAWELFSHSWRRLSPLTLIAIGMGFLIAVGMLMGSNVLASRLPDLATDAMVRQELFESHWRAFLASPWSGYGLGNFYAVNRLIATSSTYQELSYVRAVHNVYIQWLEEGGLTVALPMFACIGFIMASTAIGAHRRRRMTTWMRALVAASLVILIHGATDYALQVPSIAATWACMLGLGFGLAQSSRGAHG